MIKSIDITLLMDKGNPDTVLNVRLQEKFYSMCEDDLYDALRMLRFKYYNVLGFRYISHSKLKLLAKGIVSGEGRPDNLLAYMKAMARNGRNESNELSRMLYANADYRADWEKADRELIEFRNRKNT